MAKFKTQSSDSYQHNRNETVPCPRKFAATLITKTVRQEKVKRAFPFTIISGVLSALSSPKTHSPIR